MTTPDQESDFTTKEKHHTNDKFGGEDLDGKGEVAAHIRNSEASARKTKMCKIVLILGFVLLIIGAILTGVILGRQKSAREKIIQATKLSEEQELLTSHRSGGQLPQSLDSAVSKVSDAITKSLKEKYEKRKAEEEEAEAANQAKWEAEKRKQEKEQEKEQKKEKSRLESLDAKGRTAFLQGLLKFPPGTEDRWLLIADFMSGVLVLDPKQVRGMFEEMEEKAKKWEDIGGEEQEIFNLTVQKFNETTPEQLETTVAYVQESSEKNYTRADIVMLVNAAQQFEITKKTEITVAVPPVDQSDDEEPSWKPSKKGSELERIVIDCKKLVKQGLKFSKAVAQKILQAEKKVSEQTKQITALQAEIELFPDNEEARKEWVDWVTAPNMGTLNTTSREEFQRSVNKIFKDEQGNWLPGAQIQENLLNVFRSKTVDGVPMYSERNQGMVTFLPPMPSMKSAKECGEMSRAIVDELRGDVNKYFERENFGQYLKRVVELLRELMAGKK